MTRYVPGVPDPTPCPSCGHMDVTTSCRYCKVSKINAAPQAIYSCADTGIKPSHVAQPAVAAPFYNLSCECEGT
jgi:hypothetical protein